MSFDSASFGLSGKSVPAFARVEDPYQVWLEMNAWRAVDAQRLRVRLARARGRLPRISVVMPVYAPPIPVLQRTIESVQQQVYGDWELCIADDVSPDPGIVECLARHAASDRRIHVARNAVNLGIAGATNAAAALAKGDFIAFLDHDDELTPDALAEMALYVAERPDTDFLYSDDDKIDIDGNRFGPQFKPDWSPELLLSYMYMGHLIVVRRTLFEELGGTRADFDGSQDFDFALRATQRARTRGTYSADPLPLAGDPRFDGAVRSTRSPSASRPAARPSRMPCAAAASLPR